MPISCIKARIAVLDFWRVAIGLCALAALSRPALAGNGISDNPQLRSSTTTAPPYHKAESTASQKVLHGNVDYLANVLHGAGLQIESRTLPASITDVRIGSPAFYGGVCVNDKLLSCNRENNQLAITISRGGQIYALRLRSAAAVDERIEQKKTSEASNKEVPRLDLTDNETKVLKDSEFVIMIDRSGSMSTKLNYSGPTRSQWCLEHIEAFCRSAAAIANKKLTLVPFSGTYYVRRNCSPDSVVSALRQAPAEAGTEDIATPLEKLFDDYLASGSHMPLIIAIITDGVPHSGADLGPLIKRFTQKLSNPKQVKVIFFLIGGDTGGETWMTYLDNDLYREGAKYDIVDSYKFAELQKIGMDKALLKSK